MFHINPCPAGAAGRRAVFRRAAPVGAHAGGHLGGHLLRGVLHCAAQNLVLVAHLVNGFQRHLRAQKPHKVRVLHLGVQVKRRVLRLHAVGLLHQALVRLVHLPALGKLGLLALVTGVLPLQLLHPHELLHVHACLARGLLVQLLVVVQRRRNAVVIVGLQAVSLGQHVHGGLHLAVGFLGGLCLGKPLVDDLLHPRVKLALVFTLHQGVKLGFQVARRFPGSGVLPRLGRVWRALCARTGPFARLPGVGSASGGRSRPARSAALGKALDVKLLFPVANHAKPSSFRCVIVSGRAHGPRLPLSYRAARPFRAPTCPKTFPL